MSLNKKEYNKLVEIKTPKSPKIRDFLSAYAVGGLICLIGELIFYLLKSRGMSDVISGMLVPCIFIFVSALLTGLKIYPKIAKFAGAGILVPITGFANAVVSPAIEFKNEGQVLGVGAKIFTISGPVILFGTVASVVYGIIYYIFKAVI